MDGGKYEIAFDRGSMDGGKYEIAFGARTNKLLFKSDLLQNITDLKFHVVLLNIDYNWGI